MSSAILDKVTAQDRGFATVSQVLRSVATGVSMSRHVEESLLFPAVESIAKGEVDSVTAATFLTAFSIFTPNPAEQRALTLIWDADLAQDRNILAALLRLNYRVTPHPFWNTLQRLLQSLSKVEKDVSAHLSTDEINLFMDDWLMGKLDDALAVSMLLALRMTEETDEENRTVLSALRRHAKITTLSTPHVIDLADPTDGFSRLFVPTPLVAALLAQLGFKTVVHGLPGAPSKWGVTHEDILKEMGYPFPRSVEEAATRIMNRGWVYLSQSLFLPALTAKIETRARMVKRVVINTVEKLILPIRAETGDTRLLTGYVHKGYDKKIFAIEQESSHCVVVKGIEGSIIPRTKRVSGWMRVGQTQPTPLLYVAGDGMIPPPISGRENVVNLYEKVRVHPESPEAQFVVEAALFVLVALGFFKSAEEVRQEAIRALGSVKMFGSSWK